MTTDVRVNTHDVESDDTVDDRINMWSFTGLVLSKLVHGNERVTKFAEFTKGV